MQFTPSPDQSRFFTWIMQGEGSAILEAVAGSGKTTSLVEGIKHMSGRVWIGVYNKAMGDELKARIGGHPMLGNRRDVFTSTFHAAGFGALRRAYPKIRVDNDKCRNIARQYIAEREGQDQRRNKVLRDATYIALRLVSLAKNQCFSPADTSTEDWEVLIQHHDLDIPAGVSADTLINFAQEMLCRSVENNDLVDFDDMIYLPVTQQLKMYKHDWVLIDEAQDTNPARRELADMMLAPNGRLVAVGDPHQAIYGFTGADNDSLDILRERYGAVTLRLGVTFRCPKAVVAHARQWVDHIEAHPDAAEGEVLHSHEDTMRSLIANMSRTELTETAILCRVTKHLVRLCYAFIRAGTPARIEGRAIGEGLIKLATKWQVTDLADLSDKVIAWRDREIAKAIEQEKESQAERLQDQADTLLTLILVTNRRDGHTVSALIQVIEEMFDDDVSQSQCLTLCTSHRAKGREWNRVFLLGRKELMPSPWAQKKWMQEQELNLIYVSVTRAMQTLVEVDLAT